MKPSLSLYYLETELGAQARIALAGVMPSAVNSTPPKHSAARQQLPNWLLEHRSGITPSHANEILRMCTRVLGTSSGPRKWRDKFALRTATFVIEMLSTTEGTRLFGSGHHVLTIPSVNRNSLS